MPFAAVAENVAGQVAPPAEDLSSIVGQFTPEFYENRRKSYVDFAMPQLNQQFGDAKKQLTFALTRSGALDSSSRADQEARLQREYDKNTRDVGDKGVAFTNQARNSVEDARAQLIASLNASGDDVGAANQAISRARALSQPDTYSSLGPMFSNFTSGLGTQAALERAHAMSGGLVSPRYNTGLFANPGAVKVS